MKCILNKYFAQIIAKFVSIQYKYNAHLPLPAFALYLYWIETWNFAIICSIYISWNRSHWLNDICISSEYFDSEEVKTHRYRQGCWQRFMNYVVHSVKTTPSDWWYFCLTLFILHRLRNKVHIILIAPRCLLSVIERFALKKIPNTWFFDQVAP